MPVAPSAREEGSDEEEQTSEGWNINDFFIAQARVAPTTKTL